eukprot:TRINITY_DN6156_c0_g1_i1.p1 TRINITY_DN6156_c0_g1~~TRINITY_DN6156_c0_g1_i1.p1  ORF type:complete len:860 (-),score=160.70 TRINITY_DN6156_c0_g1_i1:7-2586(-)
MHSKSLAISLFCLQAAFATFLLPFPSQQTLIDPFTNSSVGDNGALFGNDMAYDSGQGILAIAADGQFFDFVTTSAGAVFLYQAPSAPGGNFTFVQMLSETTSRLSGDFFGSDVAIGGGVIVVGADGRNQSMGKVYVYEQSGSSFVLTKTLSSPQNAYHRFGFSVAVAGDFICVGAPGSSIGTLEPAGFFIYQRNFGGANNWGLTQQFLGDRQLFAANATGLGADVAVTLPYLFVGAPSFLPTGSVAIFQLASGTWTNIAFLSLPLDTPYSQFGRSVAASGNTLVVGAPTGTFASNNPGAAFVYELTNGVWTFVAVLKPCEQCLDGNCDDGDEFGQAVSIYGDTIVVGARDETASRGGVYVFNRYQSGVNAWGMVAHLIQPASQPYFQFGAAVLATDTWVLGGGPLSDQYVPGTGEFVQAAGATVVYLKGCAISYYQNGSSCVLCPATVDLAFNDSYIISKCFPCPLASTLLPAPQFCNQSACVDCPTGYVCPPGQRPSACPLGSFNNRTLQTSLDACLPCEGSSFTATMGAAACSSCPGGGYCVGGVFAPCPANTFSNISDAGGSGACQPCPQLTTSGVGATECIPTLSIALIAGSAGGGAALLGLIITCVICRYRSATALSRQRKQQEPLLRTSINTSDEAEPTLQAASSPGQARVGAWMDKDDIQTVSRPAPSPPVAFGSNSVNVVAPVGSVESRTPVVRKNLLPAISSSAATTSTTTTTATSATTTTSLDVAISSSLPALPPLKSTLPPLSSTVISHALPAIAARTHSEVVISAPVETRAEENDQREQQPLVEVPSNVEHQQVQPQENQRHEPETVSMIAEAADIDQSAQVPTAREEVLPSQSDEPENDLEDLLLH